MKQIDISPPCKDFHIPTSTNDKIKVAEDALERLKAFTMPVATQVRKCPVAHKTVDQEDFEHDFTTQGRIGDLGCPFARIQNGPDGQCGPDPIAEEFHGEKASARSRSSAAAGSRCPIRFLDKHSPEEVAQYFENHKHEIPRSHQICVKRYQQNEQSIRQLDAKYGNLVSMIQGLGNKHKQYLPEDEKVADEPEQDSTKAVEKWANNVDHSEHAGEPERLPNFERPLRDIRVGESPSRPWGIAVPVGKTPAASVSPSENSICPATKPVSVVPSPAVAEETPVDNAATASKVESKKSGLQPQIIFNGPVFFGYSAEQAALFLQNLNIGSGPA